MNTDIRVATFKRRCDRVARLAPTAARPHDRRRIRRANLIAMKVCRVEALYNIAHASVGLEPHHWIANARLCRKYASRLR